MVLKEASYGGAYDIEDDMYFTKEDLLEFTDELIDTLQDKGIFVDLVDMYMTDGNRLVIAVEDEDGNEIDTDEFIDMRKIRRPKDIYKYRNIFIKDILSQYDELKSFNEDLDDEIKSREPQARKNYFGVGNFYHIGRKGDFSKDMEFIKSRGSGVTAELVYGDKSREYACKIAPNKWETDSGKTLSDNDIASVAYDDGKATINYMIKNKPNNEFKSFNEDLDEIPVVDRLNFINKRRNGMPGIANINEFIDCLNAVGKDKFMVKETKVGSNLSLADLKDEWMTLKKKGWKWYTKNIPGDFLTYYVFEKTNDNSIQIKKNIDEAYNDNDITSDETANKLADEFYKYCVEKHIFIEECEGQFDSDDNLVISYEIYDGDWKHEHLATKFLAKEFFFEKGYTIRDVNEYMIDEDGSDTYSAHYDIEFANNSNITPEKINKGENMKEDLDISNMDNSFKYRLLDRMRSDCEYYINGAKSNKHLFMQNPQAQIKAMKDIYNSFSEKDVPEWISMEDINNYERQMCNPMIKNNMKENLVEDDLQQLKAEIENEVEKYMTSEGFEPDEVKEYSAVDIYFDSKERDAAIVEVRAEISYDGLFELGLRLDKIIANYDEEAYFEPEEPGITTAYIHNITPEKINKRSKQIKEDYEDEPNYLNDLYEILIQAQVCIDKIKENYSSDVYDIIKLGIEQSLDEFMAHDEDDWTMYAAIKESQKSKSIKESYRFYGSNKTVKDYFNNVIVNAERVKDADIRFTNYLITDKGKLEIGFIKLPYETFPDDDAIIVIPSFDYQWIGDWDSALEVYDIITKKVSEIYDIQTFVNSISGDPSPEKIDKILRSLSKSEVVDLEESKSIKEDIEDDDYYDEDDYDDEDDENNNYPKNLPEQFYSLYDKLNGDFWTRKDELKQDIEEINDPEYSVEELNDEYVIVTDPEDDMHALQIFNGGTERTYVLDFDRIRYL